MLHILIGPDDYSLKGRLKQLKCEGDDPSVLAMNTSFLDGRRLTFQELTNACDTLPFLGQRRLVIVEGLLGRFDKVTKRQSDWKEWQQLASYIDRMPPPTVLLLADSQALSQTNPLLKSLATKTRVESFPLLKGQKIRDWIKRRMAEKGGKASPRAIELLAQFSSDDLWVLANEVDKLVLYADGQPIQEEDIRKLTAYVREANVFAMVDAVMEKQAGTAVRLVHQLLFQGETVPYIMAMIARQLRLVVRARDLSSQGLRPSDLPARLGVSPNYPIDKLLRQAAGYKTEELPQIFRQLIQADAAVKTGRYKPELALDLLLADLCHQRGGTGT